MPNNEHLRDAVAKLIKAKGRFHTEQNYAELVRVFDATAAAPAQGALTDARDVALSKINAIRNSIIGFQTVNWSEHVYPLVAALEEAGIAGEGYELASKKAQQQCDLIASLEAELAAVRGQVSDAADAARWIAVTDRLPTFDFKAHRVSLFVKVIVTHWQPLPAPPAIQAQAGDARQGGDRG